MRCARVDFMHAVCLPEGGTSSSMLASRGYEIELDDSCRFLRVVRGGKVGYYAFAATIRVVPLEEAVEQPPPAPQVAWCGPDQSAGLVPAAAEEQPVEELVGAAAAAEVAASYAAAESAAVEQMRARTVATPCIMCGADTKPGLRFCGNKCKMAYARSKLRFEQNRKSSG